MKNVFENLRSGIPYDIKDPDYIEQAHGEMDRSRHLCWKISQTDPLEKETIAKLETELLGPMKPDTFLTPPIPDRRGLPPLSRRERVCQPRPYGDVRRDGHH